MTGSVSTCRSGTANAIANTITNAIPTVNNTPDTPNPDCRNVRIAKIAKIHNRLPGTNTFQPNRMNWSYRNRGNVPRNQMNTNKKMLVLTRNARNWNQPESNPSHRLGNHGIVPPPRNNVVAIAETVTMFTYSARKNSANFNDEYSVWNPPTSSDSASGRSNGARLVSPTIEIVNTRKLGISNSTNHAPDCAAT